MLMEAVRFGLTQQIGDGDLLRTEAFGDANGPLAADGSAGDGGLREDAAGGNVGRVEAILQGEAEAEGAGLFARVGEREAGEVGDFDLAAVNGEAHGDEGGEQRDDEHGKRAEEDVEEAVDAADLSASSVRIKDKFEVGVRCRLGSRAVMIGVCVRIWPASLRSFVGTLGETAVVDHRGNRRYRTTYGELGELAGRFAAELERRASLLVTVWCYGGELRGVDWDFFGCLLRGVIAVPLDAAGSSDLQAGW